MTYLILDSVFKKPKNCS